MEINLSIILPDGTSAEHAAAAVQRAAFNAAQHIRAVGVPDVDADQPYLGGDLHIRPFEMVCFQGVMYRSA